MADQKFAELLAMGYPSKYIERAIDVHKKSKYGTNWNLSILVEIIGRLQAKDIQFPPYQQPLQIPQQAPPQQLPQQPQVRLQQSDARKAYHSFLVDENYSDGLSDDSDEAEKHGPILKATEEADIFVPHYMNIQEPLALQVNDYIDYRYENGRYLLCKIIAKSQQLQNMMLLHPVGKPMHDTKYDRLVDIYQEYFKLSPAKSICLKKIKSKRHRLHSLRVNDYIDLNPFCNGHKGWVNAKIIKLDANSSQVKLLYHNNNDHQKYSFWAHLQNHQEVAPFRSKCDNVDPHQINLVNINTKSRQMHDVNGNIESIIQLQHQQQRQRQPDQADEKHLAAQPKQDEKEPNDDEQEADEAGHGEDILGRHLECSEIDDNDICAHLLKYDAFKWEFNSATVEIYRLQMNRINHTHMLPHPISIRFPQYFSSIAIPAAQTQFFANILPPKHGDILRHISIKKWRVRIIIKETTTKELISKIVLKLQTSFDIKTFDYESSQFMLKIVGCHEYILYDENKLIIDYEAVRKAVRNEDSVRFQLLYCPNFKQIEKECFNTNMHHISKYKMKYFDAGLLTKQITAKHQQKILKYCPNGCGDGEYENDDKLLLNGDDVKEEFDDDPFGNIISDFAAQSFDVGHDDEILPDLASMKDVSHLLKTIDRRNNEIFLHEFDEFYCIKIMFLLNVTQFPLYKHYYKKHKGSKAKWSVLVRHELWIGSLRYDACTFDTDYKHGTSVGMRFNQSFCARIKYCDLAREACLSFTVYLCKINESKDDKVCYDEEIAIAFVRFPLIDDCNILRKGQYSLNLWPIPLFVSYYKGPKCDAFADLSFKYTGTTVDRYLKKFKDNKEKELQNVFKLGIEFKEYSGETIIALPLNHRFDFKKSNYKSDNIAECDRLIAFDLLHEYNDEEKQIVWKHRDILSKNPAAFAAFVRCIDFRDKYQRSELYAYVSKWKCNDKNLSDFLELLSYEFMDNYIRQYVVTKLHQMSDDDLQIYLLQLVQCLKYELHHNNALIRLLMRRCILNPNQIGHYFWWHIKSEYADNKQLNLMYVERFALYLEEYLLFSQTNIARNILIQTNLSTALNYINNKLRKYSKSYKGKNLNLLDILRRDLNKLNQVLPPDFILPIQPKWHCKHIIIDDCKIMSSAQMPLWLTFENVDCGRNTMMFKAGDDLRQDILTLNVIRVIDKIWLDRGLNLNLLFYAVICSGFGQGMVEIVLDSSTTTHIHTHYGGGPQKGARDITTHLKYLCDVNQNNLELVAKARDIYTRSCAGYCIASYVLGLGDRHPSNIMLRRKGELFHIDFSHFLGNFKSQKVIGDFVKWQREVAPFVFLPANKYCIENGAAHSFKDANCNNYQTFIQYNVNAYLSLRQKHKLLVNLFVLMLPSRMPELIIKKHIHYLRDQLHLYDISNQNVYKHILKILDVCLSDKRRIMDNMIHAMVHQ